MKEFVIKKNDTGQRLDRFVTKVVPMLPSSLVQKYIRIKRIKVNNKSNKRDYKLIEGDTVQMYINDEFFEENTHNFLTIGQNHKLPELNIVYEDENILLINKPSGILCHSDKEYDHSTIIARIQAYLLYKNEWNPKEENSFTPALCNRIDRNTSGIIIAAKNAETLRIINEKLRNHEIDRYYLATVVGEPIPPSGRLEAYIFKDAVKNRVYVTKHSQPGAKTAIMEYRTLETNKEQSLLECKLITGRTHQIRAQLAYIGFPIVGDDKYGSKRINKELKAKHQALCSYKLVFSFKTDAGKLEYLKGREFAIPTSETGT